MNEPTHTMLATTSCAPHPSGNCRSLLRDATHASHVRLNHHRLLAGMVRPGYERASYARVLVAYFHFYRALEAAIERYLDRAGLDFDYTARRKTAWLASDLRVLGIDPDAAPWLPPRPPGDVTILSAAQLVGALYTIEGATLGGQLIARQLALNLGLRPASGARFFHGYGKHTQARWTHFLSFIETQCEGSAEREQAARSACATFAAMEGLLDDYAA